MGSITAIAVVGALFLLGLLVIMVAYAVVSAKSFRKSFNTTDGATVDTFCCPPLSTPVMTQSGLVCECAGLAAEDGGECVCPTGTVEQENATTGQLECLCSATAGYELNEDDECVPVEPPCGENYAARATCVCSAPWALINGQCLCGGDVVLGQFIDTEGTCHCEAGHTAVDGFGCVPGTEDPSLGVAGVEVVGDATVITLTDPLIAGGAATMTATATIPGTTVTIQYTDASDTVIGTETVAVPGAPVANQTVVIPMNPPPGAVTISVTGATFSGTPSIVPLPAPTLAPGDGDGGGATLAPVDGGGGGATLAPGD